MFGYINISVFGSSSIRSCN